MTILLPLKEVMHAISSGLLIPTIAVLLFMLALSMAELGGSLVEAFTERRKMKVNVSELINAFQEKDSAEIMKQVEVLDYSGRQKIAISELLKNKDLTVVSLQALARRLLASEELYYVRITNRTDLVTRLGPMLGLMATLIPLGPGFDCSG